MKFLFVALVFIVNVCIANSEISSSEKPMPTQIAPLAHQVYFWLKNPDSKEDQQKLIEGIKTLAAIPQIKGLHIGVPASTEKREVIDNTYAASELLFLITQPMSMLIRFTLYIRRLLITTATSGARL